MLAIAAALSPSACSRPSSDEERAPATRPGDPANGASAAGGGSARHKLVFGVVPQQSAAKLARLWQPLLVEVGARADVTLEFATAPDIPTFEQRLRAGEYDIAYMNPLQYVIFHESLGYRALAREKDTQIRGVIVVRRESPIHDLSELEGQTLAFPAPVAFAATILPLDAFARRGVHVKPAYVSSHDSVYRSVALGVYPAGGGVVRTFDIMEPEVRDQLRVLFTTEGHSPHAIAAHPRVTDAVVARIAQAVDALDDSEVGRALLEKLSFENLEMASDSDWDDIRVLDVEFQERAVQGEAPEPLSRPENEPDTGSDG